MSDWPAPDDPPEDHLVALIDCINAVPWPPTLTPKDMQVLVKAHTRILKLKREIEAMHDTQLKEARAEAMDRVSPAFPSWPPQLGQIP